MRKLLLSSLLSLSLAAPGGPAAAAGTLSESFDAGLGAWLPVVYNGVPCSELDPSPVVDQAFGNPAPSLNPNGSPCCGNGAYSAATFDLANGLAVEWDMYVASGYDWNWGTGGIASSAPNLSVARGDGSFLDNVACDPGYLAWVHLIDDNAYGSRPPYLHVGVIGADGVGEGALLEADATPLEDAWHRYGIVVRPDGLVEFSVDGVVRWASTKPIDGSRGPLPVLMGDRSTYNQGVRIDNVSVRPLVVPVAIDVRPGAAGCINAGANGGVPVAVLGSTTLDVRAIRLDTVRLAGAAVRVAGGVPQATLVDQNLDGVLDLVVQFDAKAFAGLQGTVTLTGTLSDGRGIEGSDTICTR